MKVSRLRLAFLATGTAVLVAAAALDAVSGAQAASAGCAVTYTIPSQWPGGFGANVSVTNLGDPVTSWRLSWSFTAGQTIMQLWSGTVAQSGAQVAVTNASWNGSIGTGASASFGFNGSWNNASNPVPASFTLNGVPCTGAATPPPTSASPSVRPTTASPSPSRTPTPTPTGATHTFTNPLDLHAPDPYLTYYNGFYYLAATTWNNTVTMRKSATLGGLAGAPDVVVQTLTRPNGAGTMWAPNFHLLDGPDGQRWYMYYVAGQEPFDLNTQRIHVLESAGTDPMGPYTFKADMLDPTQDNTWELDPEILQLNGNTYLLGTFYNGSQPMFIRQLSNPWTAAGTRHTLATPTLSWETVGGAVNEAPAVLQHNGKTFVTFSASHCSTPDYKVGLLTYNNANDSAGGGCDMNRSTRAQKFTWNADGTPNLGTPAALGTQLTAPSGE